MIEFSQIKNIQDNGKLVRYLENIRQENTRLLWKKPPEYPYMIIGVNLYFPACWTDKYGVKAVRAIEGTGGLSSEWSLTDQVVTRNFKLKVGDKLTAYSASNDTEWRKLPEGAKTVWDARWMLSDETSGKIKLYAMPNTNSGENTDFIDTAYTYMYRPKVHDTDITVDATTPVIALSSKNGATVEITSIRSNFDDYKAKYETATSGKFSKSTYPYLRGIVELDCKSTSLGINNTGGIYLIFSVSR